MRKQKSLLKCFIIFCMMQTCSHFCCQILKEEHMFPDESLFTPATEQEILHTPGTMQLSPLTPGTPQLSPNASENSQATLPTSGSQKAHLFTY